MNRLSKKPAFLNLRMFAIVLPVAAVGLTMMFFAHAATPSGEDMPTGDLQDWKLIFNDDFLIDAPLGSFNGCTSAARNCTDLPAGVQNKWWAYQDGWSDTSGNGKYTPEKVVSIANGIMNVNLHTENGVHMVASLLPKLPGVSGSQGGQQYGRYAIRFKSDSIHNYKTAWLTWPDSEVWPRDGELDFPEGDLDSTIGGFIHFQNGSSGGDQVGFHSSQTYTSWHTAVIEWMPNSCKYILDGTVIGSSTNRIPNTPMHWVIQSETNLNGSVPSATDGGNIQIDWVAVWAYSPGTPPSTPTPMVTTPAPSPGLIGDLNADGHVNVFDLSILLSHWGTALTGDIDKSGKVDVFDLSALLSHWLP